MLSRDLEAAPLTPGHHKAVLLTLCLAAFTIIEGPGAGWLADRTLTSLVVVAALLAVFLRWERRVADPMLDADCSALCASRLRAAR